MKKIKILATVALSLVLTACGHDFEGTWKMSSGAMGFSVDSGSVVIGEDFIETPDGRSEADIEVIKEEGKKYLVLTYPDTTSESFEIRDENTLYQGNEMVGITLTRIKK